MAYQKNLNILNNILFLILFSLLIIPSSYAQHKFIPVVKVAKVKKGFITPEAEFIGTVYYKEVSDIASEVEGIVENVYIEEGERVKKGDVLVKLNADILEKKLKSMRASLEEILANIEKEELDLKRIEALYKKKFASAQLYDEKRLGLKSLKKKALSVEAEVQQIETELSKKTIRAPFSGVIIKKEVERGEWLSPGSVVAKIGADDVVDIIVNVPQRVLYSVKPGMVIRIRASGLEAKAKVYAIIPQGDVATRTFPIKIRMPNKLSLLEGMEAFVILPEGEKKEALIIPRDAIVNMFGKTVVFTVSNSKALMVPVKVLGYKGLFAGIDTKAIKSGMLVVVKGNERLKNGQPVKYSGS
ncbi:MAG: efflux RND transporter periplasmic adaptor subunit [Nitrospirae bacterium]|nr:MAG: efflux RND transporter periplasmic adaptor subunit [Nitrospirota bacterium]